MTLITAGCGAKSTCVPGQSAACICSDGTGGAQVCKGDGSFAACQCASGATSPGDDMAGGGTGGNGNNIGSTGDMATGGVSPGHKRVFVTSAVYAGTVAASICQTVADSVSLGGTWQAWLSSTNSSVPYDAINVVTGTGPWLRLDGTMAFANHAQLATAPTVPIDITESGQKVVGSSVWTGTLTGGYHASDNCYGWTISSYYGAVGDLSATASWTAAGNNSTFPCADTAHVYCFEL